MIKRKIRCIKNNQLVLYIYKKNIIIKIIKSIKFLKNNQFYSS